MFDPFGWDTRSGHELREEIVEKFIPIEAPVFAGLDDFTPCDVCIATQWWTAWPVRDLPGCGEKVYLVQDDEPRFYATSTESIFAEETYRMGYRCIAYTPWMAEILVDKYGLESRYFECGTDLDVYRFAGEEDREPGLIAVYARRETERRAVDLALAGLMELFQRRPGIRVVVFGSNAEPSDPVSVRGLGRAAAARPCRALPARLRGHRVLAHHALARGAGDDGQRPTAGRAERSERDFRARRAG